MHHQYSLQISVTVVEVVWQQPFCCHASRFMSRIQFIFITTMMKTLTIILFATSLMCIQQSPGFRLPLHMNYYYRQISTTTEEPRFDTVFKKNVNPISPDELRRLFKLWFIANQEFALFYHQKVYPDRPDVDPATTTRGPPKQFSRIHM